MRGDIGRGIDTEQQVAGLHLGALGVINRLQDSRHASADFYLADTFGLRRGDRRLRYVSWGDRKNDHG